MKPFRLLLIAFLCLTTHSIHAQNDKKGTPQYKTNNDISKVGKYAIKGYLNILSSDKTTILTFDTSRILTNMERKATMFPSISVAKYRENGRFFEMGITRLGFDYEDLRTENRFLERDSFGIIQRDSVGNLVFTSNIPSRGAEVWTKVVALRLEWDFAIFYKKSNQFNAYLGISLDPSVYFQKIIPYTSASFPTTFFELANTFSVIPRATYALSNRWFMDFSVPISFVTLSGNYRYEASPILPTFARKNFNFGTRLPPNIWAIRLGVGYKI